MKQIMGWLIAIVLVTIGNLFIAHSEGYWRLFGMGINGGLVGWLLGGHK